MSHIVIIGGGFAGIWSAAGAARQREESGASRHELEITLIDPQDQMVIRPRLYEARPGEMGIAHGRILDPIGVDWVQGRAEGIDYDAGRVAVSTVLGERRELEFDRVVIAAGSQLRRPSVVGAGYLHNVDTMEAAVALEAHLERLPHVGASDGRYTAVVVGSGFTGLEVSTELVSRLREIAGPDADQVRVVLVEQADVVGPELGAGPRPVIEQALDSLGIERIHGNTAALIDPDGVELTDGRRIPARTAIWTAGMQANPITADLPAERDRLGRLAVESTLRVIDAPNAFAAGDTAAAIVEEGHTAMQSCQHAHAMGRVCGHNVAADLLGEELVAFAPDPYVTCLDLGGGGAVFTAGWDREVKLTGQAAKEVKRKINRAIYPPADDAQAILAAADWRAATRTPTREPSVS
jgi:NADH dehydrogenase